MNFESEVIQVHLEDIIPNRFQPRLSFDEQGIRELADSIKEHGIIQPLVLRKLGEKYEIIAGERRYKAATLAGLSTVPAVISTADDNTSAEVALVENVQRRDLTPIEEARSYKNLLDKGYLTQEQLAKRMGLSQSAVANKLRLLNLDEEVQQALLDEQISERHARALLAINDHTAQKEWLHRIINERMTVRQLDMELKKLNTIDTLDDDIPLVDANIDFEQIKNNAEDINPQPDKMDARTMMLPETMMTEFSDSLPGSSLPVNNQPVMAFNPLNTEDLSSKKTGDSKFFNFGITEQESAQNPEEIKIAPPSLEIFDAPTPEMGQSFIEPSPELTGSMVQDMPSGYDKFDMPALSSDNKFFTPVNADIEESVPVSLPQTIDPVSVISKLDEDPETNNSTSTALSDMIVEIRDLVNKYTMTGSIVTTEELDLIDKYQITINIKK